MLDSMLIAPAIPAGKLSTPRLRDTLRAHNRGMNQMSSADALGRFLTLTDTAEILNISANQAYALVRSGELPAIKIGGSGHWRVERAVLESYIEAKYEEARRLSLWNQSDFANLTELSIGRS
jgi:excisionase family DNA binding protein